MGTAVVRDQLKQNSPLIVSFTFIRKIIIYPWLCSRYVFDFKMPFD